MFAVRQHKNARQTIFFTERFFAVCHGKYARQPKKYARQRSKTHGKHPFSGSDL
jgi:hypothetical protein